MIPRRWFSQTVCKRAFKKPQFDVKSIINSKQLYEKSIKDRGLTEGPQLIQRLNELPQICENERQLNRKIATIQTERKSVESAIKSDKSKARELAAEIKQLKQHYQNVSSELKSVMDELTETCNLLPNLIASDVPLTEPEVIHWIHPKDSYIPDPKRNHVDIMLMKNMIDFQGASNLTGSSWYYLMNEGAELEHALISYALSKAKQAGFQMCIPPSIARTEVIDACGFRPRDMNNEQQIYHIEGTSLGLTATAEIALAGFGIQKVIDLSNGPKKLVGLSRAYRAEAGASGKDTKGLYRVHEFTKLELFCWSKPEDSEKLLESLKDFQIDLITSLGLTAKVLNMPANDLGASAYKKYDVEAWMPGRGSFGEVTSTSNCLDFQSRRMDTKFKRQVNEKLEYVHTLNGTAMAVPRILLALVENFYDPKTQRIVIPECLRPYMQNKEYF